MQNLPTLEFLSDFSLDKLFTDPSKYKDYISDKIFFAGEEMHKEILQDEYLYIFISGRFYVYALDKNGNKLLYGHCKSVNMIGDEEFVINCYPELKPLYDGMCFFIKMQDNCRALVLNYKNIKQELMKDALFMNSICRAVTSKSLFFQKTEHESALSSVESRVAKYIIENADKSGKFSGNHTVIAEYLRMSYRHFNRTIKKFIDAGCLKKSGKDLIITDHEKINSFIN